MTTSVQPAAQTTPKPTIVLVHGAWADASSWDAVIQRLQREGYPVLAAPNPLRGMPVDAPYIASILASVEGPIILVGHSYGGAVISNAADGNPNVKALVYIAADIPDVGETLLTLNGQAGGSHINPETSLIVREYPAADGSTGHDAYIKPELFQQIFAADLPASKTALMAATQRPLDVGSLFIPSAAAAWKTIPSYCMVATQDNTIGTANVRFMAERACDTPVEVDASHVVMISQPDAVADLIVTAARSIAAVAPIGR
ncbi:MAG: alpha/beta fold hydrolase [Chloroflexota bacterium]